MRTMESDYMHYAKTKSRAKYNLAVSGVPGFPLTDFPIEVKDMLTPGQSDYGYAPLMAEIGKRYGVPERNIVHTFGTSMANYLVLSALLEPGDEIITEHPVYELILRTAEHLRATVKRVYRRHEDGYRVHPEEIKKLITPKTRFILLTNLHNPSSVLIPEDTLKEIGEIAASANAYVLVDEVYLDAAFSLKPRTAFHLGDRFIVTNSLTKVYGLSILRCGWIFANEELTKRIWRMIDLLYVIAPFTIERLSVTAFQNLEAPAKRSRTLLETNRALLREFLKTRSDLEVPLPDQGTVIFPKLVDGKNEKLYTLLREKYETSIVPGSFFEMPEHFRLGYCGETEMFREGLRRLGLALDEL